jgi:hypothetical protein
MSIISFNGKNYNSLEEMPADQRAAYEQVMSFMKDENNNGIPDLFEGDVIQKMIGLASTRVIINGQEMQNVDAMSPEARAKFDSAMQKLSQLGILPQGMQGISSQPSFQSTPPITPREPTFTQSPPFTQTSPSAISEDTGPRFGVVITVILGVFLLCALVTIGFLLLNR